MDLYREDVGWDELHRPSYQYNGAPTASLIPSMPFKLPAKDLRLCLLSGLRCCLETVIAAEVARLALVGNAGLIAR